MFDLIFDERPIRSVAIQTNERFQYTLTGALQELLRVAHVYKPTRDDIRPGQGIPCFLINGENDHQNTVLCQNLAITQHNLPNITHSKSIDEHVPTGHMTRNFDRFSCDFDNVPIFGYSNMIFGYT